MLRKLRRVHSTIKAFTLVELLLALIIFAIIAVSLYSMFSNGLKIHARSQSIGKTYRQVSLGFDLLEKDIQNAINYDFAGSYPDQKSFKGEANHLQLVVPEDDELWVVEYSLGRPQWGSVRKTIVGRHIKTPREVVTQGDRDHGTWFLMRKRTLLQNFLAQAKEEESVLEAIVSGLTKEGLIFAYGAKNADINTPQMLEKVQYQNNWLGSNAPSIVRVEFLIDADSDGKVLHLSRNIDLPLGGK